MNYLFLDSSPNKDQQLAFSRPASKILDNMEEREMDEPSHGLQGSLFAPPILEKEQVDMKQTDNELLVLVNKMKDQLIGKDKKQDEEDAEEEKGEESSMIELSDLNMGTQFYVGSLSVIRFVYFIQNVVENKVIWVYEYELILQKHITLYFFCKSREQQYHRDLSNSVRQ